MTSLTANSELDATERTRVLVVDDERLARDRLAELLGRIPEVEYAGEASDGAGAIDQIQLLSPDVVFLDVQMRDLSGLDVVGLLDTKMRPQIVLVTAYDRYALQAFEAGVVDYLLKPITEERLRAAIVRCRSSRNRDWTKQPQSSVSGGTTAHLRRLVGRKGTRFYVIPVEEILYIEYNSGIVRLITAQENLRTDYVLKDLEPYLSPALFARFNRTCIVNMHHVREFNPIGHGSYSAILSNRREIDTSRQYAPAIRRQLGWLRW